MIDGLTFFSFLSFGWTLLQFLSWMIFAAALARGTREPSAWNRFFQDMLGPFSRLPLVIMLLLPALGAGFAWVVVPIKVYSVSAPNKVISVRAS